MKWLEVLRNLWKRLKWWWQGGILSAQLQDHSSPERSEAELAVDRIVANTRIAADCVAATVLRGGPTIIIKHDLGQEAFIGRSYEHAADKAIEWLTLREGRFILQGNSSELSRRDRRAINVMRRRGRQQRKKQ